MTVFLRFLYQAKRNRWQRQGYSGHGNYGEALNIILIDKNESKIIESIKHVGFSQNSYRTILPGSTYIAPPKTDAKNPFDIADEKLFEIPQTEDLSARNLQKLFQGLGRDTANELSALLETDKLKNFRAFFNREVEPNLTAKAFFSCKLLW